MPYILPSRRLELFSSKNIKTSGELNYLFTLLIKKYIDINGTSYQSFNDIVGALEGAKLEFYRRIVAPYEDKKIEENGDVY